MKNSMTLFGCGPKLALLSLPYVILSLIVMFRYPEFFDLKFLNTHAGSCPLTRHKQAFQTGKCPDWFHEK
jgi:hypothetical protein